MPIVWAIVIAVLHATSAIAAPASALVSANCNPAMIDLGEAPVGLLSTRNDKVEEQARINFKREVDEYVDLIPGLAELIASNLVLRQTLDRSLVTIYDFPVTSRTVLLTELFDDVDKAMNFMPDSDRSLVGRTIRDAQLYQNRPKEVAAEPVKTSDLNEWVLKRDGTRKIDIGELNSGPIYILKTALPVINMNELKIQFTEEALKDLAEEGRGNDGDLITAMAHGSAQMGSGWKVLSQAILKEGTAFEVKPAGHSDFRWLVALQDNGVFLVLRRKHKDRMHGINE